MRRNHEHISEDELMLLLDGELASHKADHLRVHLAACPDCEKSRLELERKLAAIAEAYRHARPKLWDASGPHALLKARLAEEERLPGVTEEHRPFLQTGLATVPRLAYLGALTLVLVCGLQFVARRPPPDKSSAVTLRPDRRFTPGSTRNATLTDLCASEREETVRQVPASLQQKVLEEYGIKPEASGKYEIDYLITPGLGGADDVKNLWPEPHENTPWNSYAKDLLEDRLHRMVCERKIPLEQAQRDISEDWIAAYKKYQNHGLLSLRSSQTYSQVLLFVQSSSACDREDPSYISPPICCACFAAYVRVDCRQAKATRDQLAVLPMRLYYA